MQSVLARRDSSVRLPGY